MIIAIVGVIIRATNHLSRPEGREKNYVAHSDGKGARKKRKTPLLQSLKNLLR
jgi:hypothetical protein